jgi:hypothetical protein
MMLCRLDEREDGAAIQKYLLEKTGQRSVPNIFISAYQSHTRVVRVVEPVLLVQTRNTWEVSNTMHPGFCSV